MKSFLQTKDLTPNEVAEVFSTAKKIKSLAQSTEGLKKLKSVGSHLRAILYFEQSSTRTFLSFANACHLLGISTSDIRDSKTSSQAKGETGEDTLRTFAAYAQVIIVRHSDAKLLERASSLFFGHYPHTSWINAGAGTESHPTQALLDLFTIQTELQKTNPVLTFAGDLKRSRTLKSLVELILKLKFPCSFQFIAPKNFQVSDALLMKLKTEHYTFQQSEDFSQALPNTDALYMIRLQDEYTNAISEAQAPPSYILNNKNLNLLSKQAIVLHPLPRREEIQPEIDSDARAKYWVQEENGFWIRAALICKLQNLSLT